MFMMMWELFKPPIQSRRDATTVFQSILHLGAEQQSNPNVDAEPKRKLIANPLPLI